MFRLLNASPSMIIWGCMHSEITCKPLNVCCSLLQTNTLDNLTNHKGHSSLQTLIGVLLEGCGRHSADMHCQDVSTAATLICQTYLPT